MLALEADEPDTEQLKWVVLMVPSRSQPRSELRGRAARRPGGGTAHPMLRILSAPLQPAS